MKALITGASYGIGRDIARELSKIGYDIIAVGRNFENLDKLKTELKTDVEIVLMDLSNEDNARDLYNRYKDIDVLVNNAGFGIFGEFTETDLEKEIDLINLNIVAVHILTKLYLKSMKEKDSGRILNVASIAGFMSGPLMATYYSSKAYVVRLSEAIREELKKDKSKVKISILCPGPVNTNFNNVANVKFSLRSLSSEYVAKYTVKKMFKNKFLIIPGISVKIAHFFSKIVPNNVMTKFVYKTQKRKM